MQTGKRKFFSLMLLAAMTLLQAPLWAEGDEKAPATSESAIQWLKEGNKRFLKGDAQKPRQDMSTAYSLQSGQAPKAAILTCCDSRVDPGTLFDAGLGDLFEVEVAGNFLTPEGRASLKYAVEHLGVKTLMVMGHRKCGAVGAALAGNTDPDYSPLVTALMPAVTLANQRGGPEDERADRAALANVELTMRKLLESDHYIGKKAEAGELKVYGAYYDLAGKVHFFKSPETMANLLSRTCPLHKLIPKSAKN